MNLPQTHSKYLAFVWFPKWSWRQRAANYSGPPPYVNLNSMLMTEFHAAQTPQCLNFMHRPLQETSVPSPRSQQGSDLVNLPSLSKGTITFPLNTVFSLSLHQHPNVIMRIHTSTHNACTESLTSSCITHTHKPPPLERPLRLFIPRSPPPYL